MTGSEMKILTGTVLENEEITDDIYQMTVESVDAALAAKPGQFVNVYMKDSSTLLPRPISICWTDGAQITLVYGVVGKGTAEMASYRAGDYIGISMPLGKGFDLDRQALGKAEDSQAKTAMVVGGGIGVPPLLELTYELTQQGIDVIAVIGFQDKPFLMKPLLKAGADLYVATDSGSSGFHGNVVELIKKERLDADLYFACGPKAMLRALTEHVLSLGKDIQVSMEERMGCGYGACVGCVCKIREVKDEEKIRNDKKTGDDKTGKDRSSDIKTGENRTEGQDVAMKKVCKDGPVFWGSEVIWDA